MVINGILIHLAKWCFLGCVVTCVVFIAKEALVMKYEQEVEEPSYKAETHSRSSLRSILDPGFEQCVLSPSKVFCFTESNYGHHKLSETTFLRGSSQTDDYPGSSQRHPVYSALYNFCRLMWELKIEVILLEPSILYCMLSDIKKIELQKQGFNILNYLGTQNVINVAVFGSSSNTLDSPLALSTIGLHGFRYYMLQRTLKGLISPTGSENVTVHHFFEKRKILIHVVVFFEKGNYLWHGAVHELPKHLHNYSLKLFTSVDSAYEEFQSTTLHNDTAIPIGLRIPLQPGEILLQIDSSKFINCKTQSLGESETPKFGGEHSQHYVSHLELVFKTSLRELRAQFQVYAMKLFIFGDTLFDWYHSCSFMRSNGTNYFHFAIWTSDVLRDNDAAFVKDLENNKHLKLTKSLGWPSKAREFRFDCLGVQVRLSYVYENENILWVGKHKSRRQYYRYEYPKFKLCTGELLGQRIQIPCVPEIIFQEDFGSNWKNISLNGKRLSHSNINKTTAFLK